MTFAILSPSLVFLASAASAAALRKPSKTELVSWSVENIFASRRGCQTRSGAAADSDTDVLRVFTVPHVLRFYVYSTRKVM